MGCEVKEGLDAGGEEVEGEEVRGELPRSAEFGAAADVRPRRSAPTRSDRRPWGSPAYSPPSPRRDALAGTPWTSWRRC